MLNKQFYQDDEYFNFFGINYNKDFLFTKLSLNENNDWKKMISEVYIQINKISNDSILKKQTKLSKSTTFVEKDSKGINKMKKNENKIRILRDANKVISQAIQTLQIIDIPKKDLLYWSENEGNITQEKSVLYFRKIFENIILAKQPPIIYTYIWEVFNNFDKSYFAHLNMCNIYNNTLNLPIINEEKQVSFIKKVNVTGLNQSIFLDFKNKMSKLKKYMEPISNFIDGRIYDMVLSSNPLLLFQIRTIVHILSTFVGSNLIMFIEKLLFTEFRSRYPNSKTDKEILALVFDATEELTEYVTKDILEDGYLSYEFIRLMIDFKITDDDLPKESNMEEIFDKIVNKIANKIPSLGDTAENSIILENIKMNVIPYYQTLYKEVTNQLLSFSDSYYRFIKNQYAGILMINKSY
jgi:hypothetical protein